MREIADGIISIRRSGGCESVSLIIILFRHGGEISTIIQTARDIVKRKLGAGGAKERCARRRSACRRRGDGTHLGHLALRATGPGAKNIRGRTGGGGIRIRRWWARTRADFDGALAQGGGGAGAGSLVHVLGGEWERRLFEFWHRESRDGALKQRHGWG